MNYNLKGGVLIIGSLFWQDDRDTGDGIRKRWRENRLDMNKSIKVTVPIRYGRFSKDQTYTMVFDSSLPAAKYGRAKAIPFKNGIVNWDQLRTEVEALSEAEGQRKEFIKGKDAWCVCCIVFNKNVSLEKRNNILDRWSQALNENQLGSNYFLQNASSYSCTTQGELEIPWPAEAENMDFLIATSLQPRNREDITSLTIHEITDHISNREYFIPNFLRGISTYQDREILVMINSNRNLTQLLFKAIVENYELKKQEDKNHRYWSWDHCYNAFNSGLDNDIKALHLANYLASWGMNRGSGGLLQKDYRIHLKTIEILSDKKYLDCISATHFDKDRIPLVLNLVEELSEYYRSIKYERTGAQDFISPTDTLISKILLGTLSCMPAYDQFFKDGLELGLLENKQFGKKGLESLCQWLEKFEIQTVINNLSGVNNKMPLMKFIDVYYWSLGHQLAINKK